MIIFTYIYENKNISFFPRIHVSQNVDTLTSSPQKTLKKNISFLPDVPSMDEVKYTVTVDKVMLNASVFIPKAFPEPSCQASFAVDIYTIFEYNQYDL